VAAFDPKQPLKHDAWNVRFKSLYLLYVVSVGADPAPATNEFDYNKYQKYIYPEQQQ